MGFLTEHGYGGGKYDVNDVIAIDDFESVFPQPIQSKFSVNTSLDFSSTGLTYYRYTDHILYNNNIYVIYRNTTSTKLARYFLRKFNLNGVFISEIELDVIIREQRGDTSRDIRLICIKNDRIMLAVSNNDTYYGPTSEVRAYDLNGVKIGGASFEYVNSLQNNWHYNDTRIVHLDYDSSASGWLYVHVFDYNGNSLYSHRTIYFGSKLNIYPRVWCILNDNRVVIGFSNDTILLFSPDLLTITKRIDWIGAQFSSAATHIREDATYVYVAHQVGTTYYYKKFDKNFVLVESINSYAYEIAHPNFEFYNGKYLGTTSHPLKLADKLPDTNIYKAVNVITDLKLGFNQLIYENGLYKALAINGANVAYFEFDKIYQKIVR